MDWFKITGVAMGVAIPIIGGIIAGVYYIVELEKNLEIHKANSEIHKANLEASIGELEESLRTHKAKPEANIGELERSLRTHRTKLEANEGNIKKLARNLEIHKRKKPELVESEYILYPRYQRIRMIHKDKGFCILSHVEGQPDDDRDQVYVVVENDYWFLLGGGKGQVIRAHVSCWKWPT